MSYEMERILAHFYPLVIASSAICCITSAVAWTHWRYVLNACPDTNCGCYLHAQSTYHSFQGGPIAYCYYATYGHLLPLLFCVIFGIYHVYRICMGVSKRKTGTTTLRQRSGEIVVVNMESEINGSEISPYYWLPASVIACFMAVYTLIYASIYTDGFEITCKQYRESLLKEIQGVGNIVPVIKGRLSCSAIFDFMDYLIQSSSFERRKYGHINSSVCFYMTLIFGWVAVIGWIAIAIVNIVQTKRTKPARV